MGAEASSLLWDPPADIAKVIAADQAAGKASGRYTSTRTLGNDYRIEEKVVGVGLNGAVRLATAIDGSQKVAVKSFQKRDLSAERLSELKSEAEVYLSLDHPHIARLEMVYETDEEAHLVMEYMEGGELYDRLRERKQYTEEDAAEASRQMFLAVAYLHAHGIAHRDLKLENFLYERKDTDHLKLIDFGFATLTDHDTKMSRMCGTLHYVAPEILAQSYTEKADIWAMGVIIFMLLTGSPPFFGTDAEVLQKIKSADVHWSPHPSFRKLSERAEEFLRTLFNTEPTARPSALEALDHPWLRCRSDVQETVIDVGILNNLRNFAGASQFRRNVLYMMAWSTSTDDRIQLREQFMAIDRDNTGTIKLPELKAVLGDKLNIEDSEVEYLFRSLDTCNNDVIEYSEFLAAALPGDVKAHDGALRRTFARFDTNGDGAIDEEELASVLGDCFGSSDIEEIIRTADTSGDGKLDYEEFSAHFDKPDAEGDSRKGRLQKPARLRLVVNAMICSSDEDNGDVSPRKRER